MYLTEDEARKKWCPNVRTAWAYEDVRNGIFVTANRGHTDDKCRCIASDCMAWRLRFVKGSGNAEPSFKEGYCGDFGKPDYD